MADLNKFYSYNREYIDTNLIKQFVNMPNASADYENKIVQYIGITDINYTNAYFYKCVEILPSTDPKTYKWNKVPVQEIKDIVVFTEVDALPTTDIKDYTIYRLNKGSVGSGWKYKKFDNLNKDLYTTDYDGITEIATGTLTTWNDVNTDVTTKDNWEAKMEVTTFDEAQAVVTPDGYYPDFNHIIYHKNANTYEYWVYCGGVWKQFDSEGQIIQVDTMPTASSTLNGKIYQFVGTTTATYTNGYFYKCVEDTSTTPSTYKWININVQNGGEIIDNLTSTDTDKALSANMGRELNDIKNVTSDIDKLVFKNMTQAEYDAATSHENEIVFITDSEPSSPSIIDDTQFVANKVLSSSKVKSMFEGFVGGLSYKVVATLPTTDIDDKVIYMVPTGVANEYNRWQYINSIWVDLGKTGEIDFSNYYNKTDVNNLLSEKVNTTDIVDNLSGSTESSKPLSAKQGNILNNLKLNKSDITVDTATGVVTITY